jgi:hypothetical protein
MSEQTMMADITRANRARDLVENTAYTEAISSMRQQAQQAFLECPVRDTQGMQLLHQHALLIEKLDATVRSYAETGRLAQLQLDSLRAESVLSKAARKLKFA